MKSDRSARHQNRDIITIISLRSAATARCSRSLAISLAGGNTREGAKERIATRMRVMMIKLSHFSTNKKQERSKKAHDSSSLLLQSILSKSTLPPEKRHTLNIILASWHFGSHLPMLVEGFFNPHTMLYRFALLQRACPRRDTCRRLLPQPKSPRQRRDDEELYKRRTQLSW